MRDEFSGKYVAATLKEHKGKKGVVLKFFNPDSKVNTVPAAAFAEIHRVLVELQEDESTGFMVLHGTTAKIHAGAELTLFAGDPDLQAVHDYLLAGTRLDLRLKEYARTRRTVSIMQGERYGGSVEWPLMAQYSICTPDTAIQFSEVNIGLIPGWDGILNVMLRSNKENALYLAATGNRIDARAMSECGLVSLVCSEENCMEMALDLATMDTVPPAGAKILATVGEINKIIAERTDAARYRALAEEVSDKLETGELGRDRFQENYVSRFIAKRLEELGKPLAPLAVQAVFDLIDAHPQVHRENYEAIKEMALGEAESCFRLMKTADRKTGVNSILTKDPLQKIPIYVGAQDRVR